jgi:hypothetical protein
MQSYRLSTSDGQWGLGRFLMQYFALHSKIRLLLLFERFQETFHIFLD